jgi:DNA mismatch endonuclease, patch repair protein
MLIARRFHRPGSEWSKEPLLRLRLECCGARPLPPALVTDTRTPEQRRAIMRAVRGKNTSPEIALRRALYASGLRGWRCHWKAAPGSPDIAWPSRKVAVFVDGAFWHGHPSRHTPGRSGAYWDEKIAANQARDRRVDAELRSQGWRVLRVWDFEVKKELDETVGKVRQLFSANGSDAVPRSG